VKRSPLKADPEKVREFMRRGRESSALARTALKSGRRKRRPPIPEAVRLTVVRRSHGACLVCLLDYTSTPGALSPRRIGALVAQGVIGRAEQLHHLLPVREWPRWLKAPDNMVALCEACHDRHERAFRRLRWEWLPEGCRLFLMAVADADGTAWAYLARTYPGSGPSLAAPGSTTEE
jgi:hypothetical protein